MSQHLPYVYSIFTQSQLNFAMYCVSAVQQTTCFIITTKLPRSMIPHVIVTLILNTKHLKTHAVSLSLLLYIKKKLHYGKFILHFFPSCIRVSLYIYIYIYDVSRLEDITAGGDFLGLCNQKSSYEHVSDFGRLRSYDRLKLSREGNDY